jgi:arylsulfatase
MWEESGMYLRWYGDQMWLFVPIQEEVQKFLATKEGYPFQEWATLNASGINYKSLKAMKILQQIRDKGVFEPAWQ